MNELHVLMLDVDRLLPNLSQPRKSLSREDLDRMAASVATRGILQPIRVRRDETRECWEIVTGESRWRAAKLAGLKIVPCLPLTGEATETDILADQLVEDVVRNALTPMELARGLAKYRALRKCTAQQMAAELGMTGGTISKAESLLSLPEDVQALVESGSVKPNAAYEISRLPDAQSQRALAHAVASGKVGREGTADAVRSVVGKRNVKPKAARLPLRLDGGISITVSAAKPLSWDDFNAAVDRVRKVAKKLYEEGKDLSELARLLRAS